MEQSSLTTQEGATTHQEGTKRHGEVRNEEREAQADLEEDRQSSKPESAEVGLYGSIGKREATNPAENEKVKGRWQKTVENPAISEDITSIT